jgi:hypothetical protein
MSTSKHQGGRPTAKIITDNFTDVEKLQNKSRAVAVAAFHISPAPRANVPPDVRHAAWIALMQKYPLHPRHDKIFSCDGIRIWQLEIIKIPKCFWTVQITITRIKLLPWLCLANKNPRGIACSCLTKSEIVLTTLLDYFASPNVWQ